MACLVQQVFSNYLINGTTIVKKNLDFLYFFAWKLASFEDEFTEVLSVINVVGLHVKLIFFPPDFAHT